MNTKIQLFSLLVLLSASACVPTLQLKQPQTFNGQQVKRMQFEDACGLQRYFDRKPPRILILGERAVSTGSRTEVGTARVLLRRGPQLTKLGELLKRFYRDVPAWLLRSDVTVMTDFLRRIPRIRKRKRGVFQERRGVVLIPTTAAITLKAGPRRVQLDYHPCIGELLFGRRVYELRARLLRPAPRRRSRPPAPTLPR